jgi:N-acetylglutamate synthase-like GNAT family acetyltransferase
VKNLKLRKAVADDSEFAYQTKKAAFRGYLEKSSGWNEEEQRKLHQWRFAEQDFRVIQVYGKDVGIMAMSHQPDCIKLFQMFILPGYQDEGIGEAFMKLLIKNAADAQLPIRLQVLKVNPRAFVFYQRLGFKKTDENANHILMEKPA